MTLLYFIFAGILILSITITILLMPIVFKFAFKFNAVDEPGQRKVHSTIKPRLGGAAFFISFWTVLIICWVTAALLGWADSENHRFLTGLLIGSIILFTAGLYDDLFSAGPYIKLTAQFLAGIAVIISGTKINLFIPYKLIGYILTIIWIIGLTNSFNLLDNMDGLSAGLGIICSFMMFLIGIEQNSVIIILISIILAGSLIGFLKYNFYPSKIFMGDSGSYFIGFILSVISVQTTYISNYGHRHLPVIIPLLIFSVPIFDTLSVIYIRRREHRSIFKGDMSHFSHRLVAIGMTQKQAVLFIYLVSFIIGISATFLITVNIFQAIIILCQSCAIFVIIIIMMRVARNVVDKSLKKDFDDYPEYY